MERVPRLVAAVARLNNRQVSAVLAECATAGIRGAIILSAVMFLLAFLAQSILAGLGEDSPVFGGLHALDGLAILALAGFLYASSRRR